MTAIIAAARARFRPLAPDKAVIHHRFFGPQPLAAPLGLYAAASDLARRHREAAPRRVVAPEPEVDEAAVAAWLAGEIPPPPPPACAHCDGWGRFGDDVECGTCRGTGMLREG